MKRTLRLLALSAFLNIPTGATPAPPPTTLSLARLDCGTVRVRDLDLFSDVDAYRGKPMQLTSSCYLIRHGDTYMLWDTGLAAALKGAPFDPAAPISSTVALTIKEQLAQLGITPEQISVIGISHYHGDHVGQAADFPHARLLIGAADWNALSTGEQKRAPPTAALRHWLNEGGTVELVKGDKDVFGDASVVMLDMPGHTPGHHSLIVNLARDGAYLLTGDVTHFRENYASDGIPDFNTDRAASLASLDRFKRLAGNRKATVVIQHDERDIAKLPAFPKAAR